MIEVSRRKTKDFYTTIVRWLKLHDWGIIPESVLPKNVFVLSNNNEECYCVFLYETDSDFGFLGFPISNKDSVRNNSDLTVLFDYVKDYAKGTGIKLILTTSGTRVIERTLINSGYAKQDENVNQYTQWVN